MFKSLGKNVKIGPNVYFRYPELVEIGDNVIIDDFCYFTTSMKIGGNVHIGPHCTCIGGKNSTLIMGIFSGLSAGVRLICNSDDFMNGLTGPTIPMEFRPHCSPSGKIVIERHGLLGTNSVVMPNVTIEKGAATGAMTLVTKDLEAWWVYIGSPAKKFKRRNEDSILRAEAKYFREGR